MVATTAPAEDDGEYRHAEVLLASGERLKVIGIAEARWFTATRKSYLDETRFTETTDLRDLDRLLIMELMILRWSTWLAADEDYWGEAVNDEQLRKNIKEYSASLNILKESMGLTKRARDDAANAEDFSRWWDNLLLRAEAFGVHREDQLQKALILMNELSAVVGTFDRCDEEEREKIGFQTEADIVTWVREQMLPEYHALDEHFTENEQRYWQEDSGHED